MSLFKKAEPVVVEEKEPELEPVIVEEPPKKRVFEPIHKTMIGEGITLCGNFFANDAMEIRGTVEGDISATKSVTIFENGKLDGNADVAALIVNGIVEGNVNCDGLAVFTETGKMEGDLKTRQLRTDEGSAFTGTLKLDLGSKAQAAPAIDLSEEGDVAVTEEDLFN